MASTMAEEVIGFVRVEEEVDGVRVVASFVGGWGHAEPLIPLASMAARLGHDVSFAGQAAIAERLARLGHRVDVVGPDTLATSPQPLVPIDRDAERAVMRDHFVASFGRTRAAQLGELFDRDDTDLVICDEVDVGAIIAAELRDIPCVTVNVIAAGLLTGPRVLGAAWNRLRDAHGLEPDPDYDRISGDLSIAPIPRSLRSPDASTPPTMRFVRPPILDGSAPTAAIGERPLVYATLGTVFNLESGDLLARLVHAMNLVSSTADIDVVVTTGPNVEVGGLPRPRPGVRIEAFVPQRELLARSRAVVFHAGSGTLGATLAYGVPIVALPLGADQPDNADRCEALGVGVALDALSASPEQIADATVAVMTEASFGAAAGSLAAESRSQPDIQRLPELEGLLARRPAG